MPRPALQAATASTGLGPSPASAFGPPSGSGLSPPPPPPVSHPASSLGLPSGSSSESGSESGPQASTRAWHPASACTSTIQAPARRRLRLSSSARSPTSGLCLPCSIALSPSTRCEPPSWPALRLLPMAVFALLASAAIRLRPQPALLLFSNSSGATRRAAGPAAGEPHRQRSARACASAVAAKAGIVATTASVVDAYGAHHTMTTQRPPILPLAAHCHNRNLSTTEAPTHTKPYNI